MKKQGNIIISKSRYLNGLQCPKLLWTVFNAKEEIPPPDAATQAKFDEGKLIGEYAKKRFPDGIEITAPHFAYDAVVRQTETALAKRVPLFEAGFLARGAFARADILVPADSNQWDVIEVKSSTELKEVHIDDLALQLFVYEAAGLSIRRCYLSHVNNEYERDGEINIHRLFIDEDITEEARARLSAIAKTLTAMAATAAEPSRPDVPIGPHCRDPYPCPLIDACWSFLPEHNIFTLYRMRGTDTFALLEQGYKAIADLPADFALNEKQTIQRAAAETGEPHVDGERIREFLSTLLYPLYFLDFETFQSAVPLFNGTHPYQQIPFQFSLHIMSEPNGTPAHHSYLAEGTGDPRPEFLARLRSLLGTSGSVVAYNATFELGILRACAERFPEYADWVRGIESRAVDLLEPFRAFAYYHPAQKGSASLKAVLPAMTDISYEGLEIAEGAAAGNEFVRVTYHDASESDRAQVRHALEQYCSLDTRAMVEIVNRLHTLSS